MKLHKKLTHKQRDTDIHKNSNQPAGSSVEAAWTSWRVM